MDCDPDDIENTRAECYGVLALHTWLDVLLDTYVLSCGEVMLYSDNKDSLCEKPIHTNLIVFPRFFRLNMDIKLQIQTMRKSLKPITVIPTHIKGHQDDQEGFEYDKAPEAVQCNIDADHTSKTFLKTHQVTLEPSQTALSLPNQRAYLSICSTVIQNNLEDHIKLHFFDHKLEQRLIDKNLLPKA